ncbi:MAG: citryl-CoA lyase, partial [Thiotrichaceae bacterium]
MTDKNEKTREQITTNIWREEAEPDNPFAAAKSYCAGFDVYGDLLGKISLIEYLWLLFKLEPPSKEQARMLEGLAVALANPGPRD